MKIGLTLALAAAAVSLAGCDDLARMAIAKHEDNAKDQVALSQAAQPKGQKDKLVPFPAEDVGYIYDPRVDLCYASFGGFRSTVRTVVVPCSDKLKAIAAPVG